MSEPANRVLPATPLPWRVAEPGWYIYGRDADGDVCVSATGSATSDDSVVDAAYIVEACNAYPDLRTRLSQAEAVVEAIRKTNPSAVEAAEREMATPTPESGR